MSAVERKRKRAIVFARNLVDHGDAYALQGRTSVGFEGVETTRVDAPEVRESGFYVQAWVWVSDADLRR